jgi:16S rRNA processing protein RimM
MAESKQPLLEVGKVSGVFGVKGWVKVYSFTEPREGIYEYSPWWIYQKGQWREVEVEAGQRNDKLIIVKLKGVDDRDQAQLLTGAKIAVDPQQLEALDDGQYYWRQIEGLRVVTTDGVELGKVDHLLETGANDVMVVKGDRERLIPFTQGHAVQKVDLAAGVITVDWDPEF